MADVIVSTTIIEWLTPILLGIIAWQNNKLKPFVMQNIKFLKSNIKVLSNFLTKKEINVLNFDLNGLD